ncbi:hypothetical protein DFP72DRAFT_1170823 [Ephemerocybe angulata]|uniref:F-box domain-containing protein n=1 Tax=Ephemerocybe angulata TaxID=980116 RepID=A0A8H6HW35_9AGAR|nr:hypothetical protein DFP72DRAFT_1170823 [Tulosesus angulatus]
MSITIPPHETSGSFESGATNAITEDIGSMNLGREMASFPLMDLPHELVIEIFQFATIVHGRQANAVCPLLLGKICRSWRAVVFETCTFWREVNLIIDPHAFFTQISLLAEWTARAGGSPLSVSIIDPKNTLKLEASEEDLTCLFDLLQNLSPQTRSLDLEIPDFVYDRWVVRGLDDYSWPLLSNLALSTTMGSSDLSHPSDRLNFSSCPVLTSVTIKAFYHHYIYLPWRSLLHIHFDSVFCSEIHTALESCPLLQTLVSEEIVEDRDTFSAKTIDHRSLKQLTLELDKNQAGCDQCCRLLNSLRLPELRTLVLKLGLARPIRGFEFDIYPCISQSGCQLSELTIEGATLKEKVLVDCLRLLPTLHTLQLSNNTWLNAHEEFIGLGPTSLSLMMAAGPDGLLMLPNLKALTILGSLVGFSSKLVVELLASRWDTVEDDGTLAALQSVTIMPDLGHPNLGHMSPWRLEKDRQVSFEDWRRRGYSVMAE